MHDQKTSLLVLIRRMRWRPIDVVRDFDQLAYRIVVKNSSVAIEDPDRLRRIADSDRVPAARKQAETTLPRCSPAPQRAMPFHCQWCPAGRKPTPRASSARTITLPNPSMVTCHFIRSAYSR